MFSYTRAAIDKTIRDIKLISNFISVSTQVIYILYLIYAIAANTGTLWANICLLCVSVPYFVFHVICLGKIEPKMKLAKGSVRHSYKTVKLLLNGITLSATIYGIYVAANNISPITVVLAAITTIGWLLGVLTEIVTYFIENRKELIITAFEADIESLKDTVTKPVTVVSDFIKKATGQKIEEEKPKPTKKRLLLDKLVAERRERRRAERERRREQAAKEKEVRLAAKENKAKNSDKIAAGKR